MPILIVESYAGTGGIPEAGYKGLINQPDNGVAGVAEGCGSQGYSGIIESYVYQRYALVAICKQGGLVERSYLMCSLVFFPLNHIREPVH